jgi:UDP-N-acetylglucosamine--N-acetylmuramyl-(pentapeptide) pyrophosphoryl-undecaprenol N-acetylglucosamine transferase
MEESILSPVTSHKKTRRLLLTGGGTAGHVMPHLALRQEFEHQKWELHYIGSKGIERDIILKEGIPFHCIAAGKLRRYVSVENAIDIFRVAWGTLQSLFILRRLRPFAVFSKGGFVSVPVCVAAWLWRIPVVSHESDLTPGLANRIIARFARSLLFTFPETAKFIAAGRGEYVGAPVRAELLRGDRSRGMSVCSFSLDDARPVVMIMGGSTGADRINRAVVEALDHLLARYRIIHLTGRGKMLVSAKPGYAPFEFVREELPHLMAAADFIVGRAGANSIFEFLALHKPMLLIPLVQGSRGDQVDNARCFASHGWAKILPESELSSGSLLESLSQLALESSSMQEAQIQHAPPDPKQAIIRVLAQFDQ